MDIIEYVKLATAFIVSIGGSSVVVVALAKWFGDFMSHRLLDSYNNKHENELEALKSKYANELEETKSELEKAKFQFVRYSEKQFELYNDFGKFYYIPNNKPICYGRKRIHRKYLPLVSKYDRQDVLLMIICC